MRVKNSISNENVFKAKDFFGSNSEIPSREKLSQRVLKIFVKDKTKTTFCLWFAIGDLLSTAFLFAKFCVLHRLIGLDHQLIVASFLGKATFLYPRKSPENMIRISLLYFEFEI